MLFELCSECQPKVVGTAGLLVADFYALIIGKLLFDNRLQLIEDLFGKAVVIEGYQNLSLFYLALDQNSPSIGRLCIGLSTFYELDHIIKILSRLKVISSLLAHRGYEIVPVQDFFGCKVNSLSHLGYLSVGYNQSHHIISPCQMCLDYPYSYPVLLFLS
jgi:hypothetical protein